MIDDGSTAKTFLDWWPLSIPMIAAIGAWFRNESRTSQNEKDIRDLAERMNEQRREDNERHESMLREIRGDVKSLLQRSAGN